MRFSTKMKRDKYYFILGLLATIMLIAALTTYENYERIKNLNKAESDAEETKNYEKDICKRKGTQDRGGFCIDITNLFHGNSYILDPKLCEGIEELVGHSSVADFGAGLGQYGRCLLRKLPKETEKHELPIWEFYKYIKEKMEKANLLNKPAVINSWEGFDGGINAEEVTDNFVKHLELSVPFDFGKTYDWVISLEVGEHIPQEYEDIFINNLIKHASIGIILSWAELGQAGHSHVNTRSNEYIINKFISKGLIHDQKNQELLRQKVTIGYFKRTIMVFRKQ